MTKGKYEREIRRVMDGNEEAIEKLTKTYEERVKHVYEMLIDYPFLVQRGAGSKGGIDLLAMRGGISIAMEVKSSKDKSILSNKRERKQYRQYVQSCEERDVPLIYLYRKKGVQGEKHKVFSIDMKPIYETYLGISKSKLGDVSHTRSGNPKMVWEDGLPFHKFLVKITGWVPEYRSMMED